jgi:hypothetical protein
MIKSRGMSWAGHVARMGENMNACSIFVGSQKELEDQDLDGWIILNWILGK